MIIVLAAAGLAKAAFHLYDEYSDVRNVSPNGEYACGAYWDGSRWSTAVWRRDILQRVSTVGSLEDRCAIALDVNNAGDAIALLQAGPREKLKFHGFVWRSGAKMKPLAGLPKMSESWPRAISPDGKLIVGSVFSGTDNACVCWGKDGKIRALVGAGGAVPCAGEAMGISANSATVVGHKDSKTGQVGAVWRRFGKPESLPDLPGGKSEAQAWAVSADGTVIAGHGNNAKRMEPVRWVKGKVLPLGGMPSSFVTGMARQMSDDGKVIVGMWGNGDTGRGFVWTAGSGAVDAGSFLSKRGLAKELTGCKILCVYGITADGHTIVGAALDAKGVHRGFRASF
jgi:uncharacterized membrane protein